MDTKLPVPREVKPKDLSFPIPHHEEKTMLDITKPKFVEVEIRNDGSVLWVNVDGICRLRVCRIGKDRLVVHDHRPVKIRVKGESNDA